MYRMLYVIPIYLMDIDFFRLAISLNKCLENYTIRTEQINWGEKLSEHCRQWQFTLR